ncbi:hypothetical protein BT63DRAFT_454969 [Microthyrium microscopicum]|uniref:Thioesterase/thiol ester dehydrase-isomerase n=1 Tax=Microthyrium microscopicum TaxID=703497 RepID=A0A6A6UCA3_9PEZI|nr:hypothetical protein BT63DRAFT_454969 [Microthyrium microscopicum]
MPHPTPYLRSALSTLTSTLPQRRWSPLLEPFSPTAAHRLSQSLLSYLPASMIPSVSALSPPTSILPPGYHLVYFNPTLAPDSLLPDGTDAKHSPGAPFVRRMWAGGSVRMRRPITLDGGPGVCVERIRDVSVKGREGEEKIFVGIERRIGRLRDGEVGGGEESAVERLWSEDEKDFAEADLIERRNIVFLRERTASELEVALKMVERPRNERVKKSTTTPTFEHTLTPSASLLFRYSALTMNAHSIHLDRSYCRDVEGHRNLLVHGPLQCTLLMTLLQSHISSRGGSITSFEYRNVSPLYGNEEMRICGAEGAEADGTQEYKLWAENARGEIAVKASASVAVK